MCKVISYLELLQPFCSAKWNHKFFTILVEGIMRNISVNFF